VQIYWSAAVLGGWPSSKVGLRLPILVLKSPHITVCNYGCSLSNVSVMSSAAVVSKMLRFFNDAMGGRYMFTIFNRSLFGNLTFANRLYSLPVTYSICNWFLI
jgi:hypothetical protein